MWEAAWESTTHTKYDHENNTPQNKDQCFVLNGPQNCLYQVYNAVKKPLNNL